MCHFVHVSCACLFTCVPFVPIDTCTIFMHVTCYTCLLTCRAKGTAGVDKGALAIVLSGGYADDEDKGTSFWYTGEGGLDKKGVQVRGWGS